MRKSVLLTLLLIPLPLFATDTLRVERPNTRLRTGPASYFPVVAELARGVEVELVEDLGEWYAVKVDSLSGYISSKATLAKNRQIDPFSRMGNQRVDLRVSGHGLSAGVKGFAERFSRRLQQETADLDTLLTYSIDPVAYGNFKRRTYTGFPLTSVRSTISIPPRSGDLFFTFSEQGMGLAIAARIAAAGLVADRDLQNYVNYVGHLVAEASEGYDMTFRFFVLDVAAVNAYAAPGGFVFITRGMLEQMRSEAELACALGHEITHVTRYHGMRELEERRTQVIADDAFAELGELVDDPDDPLLGMEKELEEMGLDIYERIAAGRLAEYEEEADALGIRYAARAGYAPGAMLRFLRRLQTGGATSDNAHYAHGQLAERIRRVRSQLAALAASPSTLTQRQRFAEAVLPLSDAER